MARGAVVLGDPGADLARLPDSDQAVFVATEKCE